MTLPCRISLAALLFWTAAAAAQEPAAPSRDSVRARRASRIPLTPELERTAFLDERARDLLMRARAARMAQDSALRSYDAKSYMRVSVGLGIRRLGAERLLFRAEHAARVRWARESGVWVQTTGARAVVPMGGADMDMSPATPIPYFPGREALWFPSEELRKVREEVNDRDLIHPLAKGAEAYYRYQTGDSLQIRLPDGRAISLRELRITARRPEWRAFVGSFWFDVDQGSLVRAAYRMAAEVDIWKADAEEARRAMQELDSIVKADTGKAASDARARLRKMEEERRGNGIAEHIFSPMRGSISAITVEYGLHQGRFWLPKQNVLEGEVTALFARMPVRYVESYEYSSVNGDVPVPKVPSVGESGLTADDTLFYVGGNITIGGRDRAARDTSTAAIRAREDSIIRHARQRADTLQHVLDSLVTANGDTARIRSLRNRIAWNRAEARSIERRREQCAHDSVYFAGRRTVYGATPMAIVLPCDASKLAHSPDLPASPYDKGEQLFSEADRDQLVQGLDFALQPGWGAQRPRFHTGLDMMRYNRVEGFSLGGSATSVLGFGYTARGEARIGTGDRVVNGELSLSRSNGRSDIRVTAFQRLNVANDDWGTPLSLGASLANVLYARDEGFYYRAWGGELAGTRDGPAPLGGQLQWRLFAERQRSAGVAPNTQFSIGNALGSASFVDNIPAAKLTAIGAATEFARSYGENPRRLRFDTRARLEGAVTDRDSLDWTGYGRLMLEATMSRALGGFGFALTGAAGSSAGDLPPQRAFFVGGLQTVRGQFAYPVGDGRVGDSFWLTRVELARPAMVFRPILFYDIGWAGARDNLSRMGRPLSGAGVGFSFLDGLFRIDVSRGIHPEQRWRGDASLGARF